MRSNLQAPPPGGGSIETSMLDAALSESSLIVHNPPDIPVNAEILSVCGVAEENAAPGTYDYIVLDFIAWKVLFHAVGDRKAQNWFSTLDISKLLAAHGDDKLKNQVLGNSRDQIVHMPANTRDFKTGFLNQVAARARAADARKTTLFIMVFAPVTPEQDICVDFNSEKMSFITIDMIRDAIQNAIGHTKLPVVFMTASPLTAGWMCNPSLLGLPTGASEDNMIRVISQSCGAVFADYFMNVFTKRGTPFLTDEQRAKFRYDDITPIWSTDVQTNALHQFQRAIHELLEHRHTMLARRHNLDFKPENDAWPCLRPRNSRPLLGFWGVKWNEPEETDIDKVDHFSFLGEAFGNSRVSQVFHLRYLARIELATCPGDWALNGAAFTKELLSKFLLTAEPDEIYVKRVFDAIEFRASSMTLAHILAKALDLPFPGARCRYWDEGNSKQYNRFQTAFAVVHNLFGKIAVLPGEIRNEMKCVKFFRPSRWLSTAIAKKFENSSDVEIQKFVEVKVAPLVKNIRQTQFDLVKENKAIACLGMGWVGGLIDIKPDPPLNATTSLPVNGSVSAAQDTILVPPAPVVQPEERHENTADEPVERKDRIKQKLADLEAKKAAEKAAQKPKLVEEIVDKPSFAQGHSVGVEKTVDNPAKMEKVLDKPPTETANATNPTIVAAQPANNTTASHPASDALGDSGDALRKLAEDMVKNNPMEFVRIAMQMMGVNEAGSAAHPTTAESAFGASMMAQAFAALQNAAPTSATNGCGDTGTSDCKTGVDTVAASVHPTPPHSPYNGRAAKRSDSIGEIENTFPSHDQSVSESGASEPGASEAATPEIAAPEAASESAGPLIYGDAFWAKVGW